MPQEDLANAHSRSAECSQGHALCRGATAAPCSVQHTYNAGTTLLLVKMKEKKLLKIQSLPKVLRVQLRATSNIYNCHMITAGKLKLYCLNSESAGKDNGISREMSQGCLVYIW